LLPFAVAGLHDCVTRAAAWARLRALTSASRPSAGLQTYSRVA